MKKRYLQRQAIVRRLGYIADKPIKIKWKVSEHRKDTRTGPTQQTRRSAYAQKIYDDAMRHWLTR